MAFENPLGYILSISMCMQNFITIFHSVQEIGSFSIFQNFELDKCHFAIPWLDVVNINVSAKLYQTNPNDSRVMGIFANSPGTNGFTNGPRAIIGHTPKVNFGFSVGRLS